MLEFEASPCLVIYSAVIKRDRSRMTGEFCWKTSNNLIKLESCHCLAEEPAWFTHITDDPNATEIVLHIYDRDRRKLVENKYYKICYRNGSVVTHDWDAAAEDILQAMYTHMAEELNS